MRVRQFHCTNHRYTSTYQYKDGLYEWFWCYICEVLWCKPRSLK